MLVYIYTHSYIFFFFQFGGKLVTFGVEPSPNPQQPPARVVRISQVVTETDLVVRSNALEQALNGGQFAEFCTMKAANSGNDAMQENIWNFMRVRPHTVLFFFGFFFFCIQMCLWCRPSPLKEGIRLHILAFTSFISLMVSHWELKVEDFNFYHHMTWISLSFQIFLLKTPNFFQWTLVLYY